MSAARIPKVAGIDPLTTGVTENPASVADSPPAETTAGTPSEPSAEAPSKPSAASGASSRTAPSAPRGDRTTTPAADGLADAFRSIDQLAALQDRMASWISDLTTLHELTEELARTATLDATLKELLRTGAGLVGARRGLAVLEPADGLGPYTSIGYGLPRADLGTMETVPRGEAAFGRLLDGPVVGYADGLVEVLHTDLAREPELDQRHREVARQLGFGASYGLRLSTTRCGRLGAVVWLYDEPAEPTERQRHLAALYVRYAAELVARQIEHTRAHDTLAVVREELLPSRLPRVPGVRMAVRHRTGPRGGGDWYDALPLPEAALGLAVGSVTGSGPSAVAAMGRLRASLRAYAVMEGEDPVAVLSDLELLLRVTEPARSATALFTYVEPGSRKLLLAGAGHCPPLVVGERRAEYVETSLSAPLGMLSCWEAPSVEFEVERGETLLLYTDGLLHRMGQPVDRAFALLHAAAADAPRAAREDPELLADHMLRVCLPDERETPGVDDIVLLATRFDD
ncbi:PP2C family protein-serine/threonine phosphatase [Streptomyces silvisoli]|uniref:SpoIIE family protein phosphatase n=1 Tax=Streptomyces silvisoli TaxID=3034235 RepID=A0ABT5ZM03_9ACTN|nr:SpoIIE family protein phosphatase [Streptomyces silvisoli]MDF3290851.1 SpoIIE family protein phosphatase [Streptomyces silvisoli]